MIGLPRPAASYHDPTSSRKLRYRDVATSPFIEMNVHQDECSSAAEVLQSLTKITDVLQTLHAPGAKRFRFG
jgi:hypothetical protein